MADRRHRVRHRGGNHDFAHR